MEISLSFAGYLITLFFRHRLPKQQWWLKLRSLLRILAKHDSAYVEEGLNVQTIEETGQSLTM